MTDFVLGRPPINSQSCAELPQLVQQLATVLDALGNPGLPTTADEVDQSPCGAIIGPAYVRDAAGTPTLAYVNQAGECTDISTGGGGGGTNINVVRGTVAAASGSPSFANFTVTVDDVVAGTELSPTVTFQNVYGVEYQIGDDIIGFNGGSGNYTPDRDERSTSSINFTNANIQNSQYIVYFELTADKTRTAVEAPGTDLFTGDPITLVDPLKEFSGKAAYSDERTSHDGFRGYGIREDTGRFRIITMEGWNRLLVGTLVADDDGTLPYHDFNIDGSYAVTPFGGRLPPKNSPSYDVRAYDENGLLATGKEDDKWLLGLRDDDDGSGGPRYVLLAALSSHRFIRIKGQCVGAVARTDSTFQIDNVEAVIGQSPVSTAVATVTVTAPEQCRIDAPDNAEIYALWDETVGTGDTTHWSCGDGANWYYIARGRNGFDSSKEQALVNTGPSVSNMQWAEVATMDVVKDIDGVTLTNPTTSSLRVEVNYTKRNVKLIVNGSESATSKLGDLAGTECP